MTIVQDLDTMIELTQAELSAWSASLDGWQVADAIPGHGVYAACDKHVRLIGDQLAQLFARLSLGHEPRFERPAPELRQDKVAVPEIGDNALAVAAIAQLSTARPLFHAEDNAAWIAAHRANIELAQSALAQAVEKRDAIAALLGA